MLRPYELFHLVRCAWHLLMHLLRSPRLVLSVAAAVVLLCFMVTHGREYYRVYLEEKALRDFVAFTSRVRLTREERDFFRNLLKSFHEVCQANNITYVLFGGTLLGAYRIGTILPWDEDVDVLISGAQARLLVEAVESVQASTGLSTHLVTPQLLKFFSPNASRRPSRYPQWAYPNVDVFLYHGGPLKGAPNFESRNPSVLNVTLALQEEKSAGGSDSEVLSVWGKEYLKKDFFPVITSTFLDQPTFLPSDSLSVILAMYGADALSTCKTGHYDHREEVDRHAADQTIDVKCEKIAHLYAVNGTFRMQ